MDDSDSIEDNTTPFPESVLTKLQNNHPSATQVKAESLDARGPQMNRLFQALQSNTVLKKLAFHGSTFMEEGYSELYRIIAEGKFKLKVCEIDCRESYLGSAPGAVFGVSPEILRVLSTSESTRSSLEEIIMQYGSLAGNCGTEEDGVREALREIVLNMPSLQKLHLVSENISPYGWLGLSQGLSGSTTLLELNLSENCHIGDEVVSSGLSPALMTNTTLQTLILNNCCIGNDGLSSLVQALPANRVLKSLDLNYNRFTCDAVRSILAPSLPRLNLEALVLIGDWNYLGKDAGEEDYDLIMKELIMYLQSNTCLKTLHLNHRIHCCETKIRSLYNVTITSQRIQAGKRPYSTLDRQFHFYLTDTHRAFAKWIQHRVGARTASQPQQASRGVGRKDLWLWPFILGHVNRFSKNESVTELFYYVQKATELGVFMELLSEV
ncbi:hypothetical protein ACA910_007763 [Epithemia clementina (nom. ined.)]